LSAKSAITVDNSFYKEGIKYVLKEQYGVDHNANYSAYLDRKNKSFL
jgi:hypothetical protein